MTKPVRTLEVELRGIAEDRSYPILIGQGLLADLGALPELADDAPVVLVTNETIAPLYLSRVRDALGQQRRVTEVVLPDGEDQKQLASVEQVWQRALEDRHERGSIFIALGGGVVGDLTGFAAAGFLRGVRFIQLPTTLLSQVDSSVGGKTGINHPLGKNLIGAFHQPSAVVIDLDTLASLPDREFAAGMAEVVKYGCIYASDFYSWLMANASELAGRDQTVVAEAIARSCSIKARVVAQDEREGGLRAILNFGHTFGHAIERIQGYGDWLHGEAVAAGMVLASRLSVAAGGLDTAVVDELVGFNEAVGLPVSPPADVTPQALLAAMGSDKKVTAGKIRYILLRQLGEATVTEDVTEDDIVRLIGT